ncbi:MAG TPA: hypothetical protein VGQ83_16955 [Polyangia bacterium]
MVPPGERVAVPRPDSLTKLPIDKIRYADIAKPGAQGPVPEPFPAPAAPPLSAAEERTWKIQVHVALSDAIRDLRAQRVPASEAAKHRRHIQAEEGRLAELSAWLAQHRVSAADLASARAVQDHQREAAPAPREGLEDQGAQEGQ